MKIDWPADFDTYAWKEKGWINPPVTHRDRTYSVAFFDPARLSQEIATALGRDGYLAELNLVVVAAIDRAHITKALHSLATEDGLALLRPDDADDRVDY